MSILADIFMLVNPVNELLNFSSSNLLLAVDGNLLATTTLARAFLVRSWTCVVGLESGFVW
jgi:hypothetical protein